MVCFCFFRTAVGCRASSSTPAVCWRHLCDWCGVAHRCFEGRRTHAQGTFECHLTLAIPHQAGPPFLDSLEASPRSWPSHSPWSIDSDWQILLYPVPCAGARGACCSGSHRAGGGACEQRGIQSAWGPVGPTHTQLQRQFLREPINVKGYGLNTL